VKPVLSVAGRSKDVQAYVQHPHPTVSHLRRERGLARDACGSCSFSRAPAWEKVGVRAPRSAQLRIKGVEAPAPQCPALVPFAAWTGSKPSEASERVPLK
jgi:hypothetical protein